VILHIALTREEEHSPAPSIERHFTNHYPPVEGPAVTIKLLRGKLFDFREQSRRAHTLRTQQIPSVTVNGENGRETVSENRQTGFEGERGNLRCCRAGSSTGLVPGRPSLFSGARNASAYVRLSRCSRVSQRDRPPSEKRRAESSVLAMFSSTRSLLPCN